MTSEEIDNQNSETLHGSGAVILVTIQVSSNTAHTQNKHYIHTRGETSALATGQATTLTTSTQAHPASTGRTV